MAVKLYRGEEEMAESREKDGIILCGPGRGVGA